MPEMEQMYEGSQNLIKDLKERIAELEEFVKSVANNEYVLTDHQAIAKELLNDLNGGQVSYQDMSDLVMKQGKRIAELEEFVQIVRGTGYMVGECDALLEKGKK